MMTRYYLMIQAGRVLNETARFYYIGVSETTKQGVSDLQYIKEHCRCEGYYFERLCNEVSIFRNKCVEYLRTEHEIYNVQIQRISARDYVRSHKAGEMVPINHHSTRNQHHFLMQTDGHYRAYRNLSNQLAK